MKVAANSPSNQGRCDSCHVSLDLAIGHPVLGKGVYCSACCPTCARRRGVKGGVRG